MKKKVRPTNSYYDEYYEDINICPICKHAISPCYLFSYLHHDGKELSLYCECTFCGKPFIGLLSDPDEEHFYHKIEYLAPQLPEKINFNKHIEKLSNSFVKIYNEAHSAEVYSLNNVSGIAYRKALEFLIKDYCIYKNPNKKEEIKSKLLGQVINDYIDDIKIKNMAKVSVWLGNDETHYARKFEDKDINDLKDFIETTVYFISSELSYDSAESILNSSTS